MNCPGKCNNSRGSVYIHVWFRLKRFLGTVCKITAPQARGLP